MVFARCALEISSASIGFRAFGSQVERCLLRRQQEEATALQELLAAMHQDLFAGLQRLASEVERRLERLEERLSRSEEVGHVWTLMAFENVFWNGK